MKANWYELAGEDLVDVVYDDIVTRFWKGDGYDVASMSVGQRVVFFARTWDLEYLNGGLTQYFWNHPHDSPGLDESLRKLGASDLAEVAEEAAQLFADEDPPIDETSEQRCLESYGEWATHSALDRLADERLGYFSPRLCELVAQYVRTHKDEF